MPPLIIRLRPLHMPDGGKRICPAVLCARYGILPGICVLMECVLEFFKYYISDRKRDG
jgi:hypothetical protein